jgi:hypothetical protein
MVDFTGVIVDAEWRPECKIDFEFFFVIIFWSVGL